MSAPLPPPLIWPTPFGKRVDLGVSFFCAFFAIAPAVGFMMLVHHNPDPQLWILSPLAILMFAIFGGAAIIAFLGRRLSWEFVPLRGGHDALVELRKIGGDARGIVMPLGKTYSVGASAGTTFHSVTYQLAATDSPAGLLFYMTGGIILPPALMRWLYQLHASSGSAEPSEGAASVEAIAALAARDPFAPPAGITVERTFQSAMYRYRGGTPFQRKWFTSWAIAVASFLIWPALDRQVHWAGTLAVVGLTEVAVLYAILLCGPLTVEFESFGDRVIYRRRRFGRTLYAETCPVSKIGVDISSQPFAALRCQARLRGITGPNVQGPEASAIIWLSAALQALGRQAHAPIGKTNTG